MKKSLNLQKKLKLTLSRETLQKLEKPALEGVAGGITDGQGASACLGSCVGCNTRNTCTSRLC